MNIRKLEKIKAIIQEKNLDAVLIEKQMNFSWLTGGRGFIGLASENACGAVLVSKDNAYLISNNIENARLLTEETNGDLIPLDFLWYEEGKRTEMIKYAGDKVATDTELSQDFFKMRTVLDANEISLYSDLGKNVAVALETSMKNIKRGMTEFELAGDISARLWNLGIEPITLLIAFDERIIKHRHPLPTDNKVENLAMGVICARYKGLIISATRIVCIGSELNNELRRKHNAVTAVDSLVISKTRPGVSESELFNILKDGYKNFGYADEEKLHHQGGLTGYAARETRAMPNSAGIVAVNQAYAWNPTITGTKSEDTIVVGEQANIIVTHTDEWEYLNTEGCLRPNILFIK